MADLAPLTSLRRVLGAARAGNGHGPAPAAPRGGVAGTLPCTATGCAAVTGAACSFVDRRRRRCPTAWCPQHQVVVDGSVYCRRHATLSDRGDGSGATMPPDVDSRAAALCAWVAAHLDGRVRTAVHSLVRPGADSIVVTPVRPVFDGPSRELSWEHSWKLNTHTGVAVGIALAVREARGDEMVVRVNRQEVFRAVPPWILMRREGTVLSIEDDAKVRADFYESVLRAIAVSAYAHAEDARERDGRQVRAWRGR